MVRAKTSELKCRTLLNRLEQLLRLSAAQKVVQLNLPHFGVATLDRSFKREPNLHSPFGQQASTPIDQTFQALPRARTLL